MKKKNTAQQKSLSKFLDNALQNAKDKTRNKAIDEDEEKSFWEQLGIPDYPQEYSHATIQALSQLRAQYEKAPTEKSQQSILTNACEELNSLIETAGNWVVQARFGKISSEERNKKDLSNTYTPQQFREILSKIICAYPAIFPQAISEALMDELNAFEFGANSQLLRPEDIKLKGNPEGITYKKQLLEILAIQHVYFRVHLKMTKLKARNKVAEAYGQSGAETIRKWEEGIETGLNDKNKSKVPLRVREQLFNNMRGAMETTESHAVKFINILSAKCPEVTPIELLSHPEKLTANSKSLKEILEKYSDIHLKKCGNDYKILFRK